LGGDSSHWTSKGGSELYSQTNTGFRVYVYKSGITTAQANSWKWQVNWMAQPEGKLSSGLCAGRTPRGSTKWQTYNSNPNSNGIFLDVDTSGCGLSVLPVYKASLGGDSSHWTSNGGSELYKQTSTGFRVYVSQKGITTAKANSWKWHINWMATPQGKAQASLSKSSSLAATDLNSEEHNEEEHDSESSARNDFGPDESAEPGNTESLDGNSGETFAAKDLDQKAGAEHDDSEPSTELSHEALAPASSESSSLTASDADQEADKKQEDNQSLGGSHEALDASKFSRDMDLEKNIGEASENN
jgi:hypothetical protein